MTFTDKEMPKKFLIYGVCAPVIVKEIEKLAEKFNLSPDEVFHHIMLLIGFLYAGYHFYVREWLTDGDFINMTRQFLRGESDENLGKGENIPDEDYVYLLEVNYSGSQDFHKKVREIRGKEKRGHQEIINTIFKMGLDSYDQNGLISFPEGKITPFTQKYGDNDNV